jgi:hypothetical protein
LYVSIMCVMCRWSNDRNMDIFLRSSFSSAVDNVVFGSIESDGFQGVSS